MAEDGATREAARQAMPLDVMVATFADRKAAKDAYHTLRSMDKQGSINLEGAVVIDRDEMGKVRLEGATFPAWVWGAIAAAGSLLLGLIGVIVWLGVLVVRGFRAGAGGGEYTQMEAGG